MTGAVTGAATAVVSGLSTLLHRASSAATGDLMGGGGGSSFSGRAGGRRRSVEEVVRRAASAAAAGGGGGLAGRLDGSMWAELHRGAADKPFRVRGPQYLQVGRLASSRVGGNGCGCRLAVGTASPGTVVHIPSPTPPNRPTVTNPQDRVKVSAGPPEFELRAVDLVTTPTAVHHIARFLPCVRESPAAFSFVVNMMVSCGDDSGRCHQC